MSKMRTEQLRDERITNPGGCNRLSESISIYFHQVVSMTKDLQRNLLQEFHFSHVKFNNSPFQWGSTEISQIRVMMNVEEFAWVALIYFLY